MMTMFENTTGFIVKNGYIGREFPILRNIKQGCPGASGNFIIVTNPLLRLIKHA